MVLHMVPFLVSLSGGFLVQPQAWLSSSPQFWLGAGRRPMVFHMVLCCLAPHLVKSPLSVSMFPLLLFWLGGLLRPMVFHMVLCCLAPLPAKRSLWVLLQLGNLVFVVVGDGAFPTWWSKGQCGVVRWFAIFSRAMWRLSVASRVVVQVGWLVGLPPLRPCSPPCLPGLLHILLRLRLLCFGLHVFPPLQLRLGLVVVLAVVVPGVLLLAVVFFLLVPVDLYWPLCLSVSLSLPLCRAIRGSLGLLLYVYLSPTDAHDVRQLRKTMISRPRRFSAIPRYRLAEQCIRTSRSRNSDTFSWTRCELE